MGIVLLAGAVHAQTVNWNYAEGGWANVDPDGGSSEDGWFLGGAFELKKAPIHFFGEFNDLGDIDIWQLGGGWHGALGKRADLFADGAFYDADVDDGFRVRFGVRWMLSQRLELNGFLSWTELDLSDNKSFAANAIFDFTKRFGVGGGIEWGDNFNSARVFARFNFGPRG
jgi:hypothetical protein